MASGSRPGASTGLATPETSSSAEALEDEHQQPGENKRKKFHPFRAVRKIFRWKVKRQATPQEVVGPSKKSRSTGELQSVPDEEQTLKVAAVAPYSIGLSVSHDSVFTSDASALGDTQELCQGSSLSVNRNSHKLMFRDELFTRVQARRDSDDDDIGLPHSPCTSPTTADVLSRGLQAKSSKPQSTCSAGSLSSMFSSENDEDALGQALHDRRGDAAAEGDGDTSESFPLNHKAALHKISVKPKRTHALPRNRRLQMLSAVPPSNLPATPEVSEDATRTGTQTLGTSSAKEQASEDVTDPSFSTSSCLPSLPPKPVLPAEREEPTPSDKKAGKTDEVPPENSDLRRGLSRKHGEVTENTASESVSTGSSPTKSVPAPAFDVLSLDSESADVPSMIIVKEEVEKLQTIAGTEGVAARMLIKTATVKSDEPEDSVGAIKKVDSSSPKHQKEKHSKEKHSSGKPKAAELKLLHEIAEFNKRQQEMGKKPDPLDLNGVAEQDEVVVDVRESIRSLEAFAQERDSKVPSEVEDEQRMLDLLNGNIEPSLDSHVDIHQSPVPVQPSIIPTQSDRQDKLGDGALQEQMLPLKASVSDKKAAVEAGTEHNQEKSFQGPPHKGEGGPGNRRYSSVETASSHSSKPPDVQRTLSVEIIPFSERKKDVNHSPPSVKPDTDAKVDETREPPSMESQAAPSENIPEKIQMNYPVHFRIYKGRRKSLAGDENHSQAPEPVASGPRSLSCSLGEKPPVTHHFEVKIHSSADVKDKSDVLTKPIVLDSGEKVEISNSDHSIFAQERSKSTSEIAGSPPKKEEMKPRPFSRGVQGKGTTSTNEPELFKVFARRSLKQKHSGKNSGDNVDTDKDDSADDKTELKTDHRVSTTAAGGTIVQISESATTVTLDTQVSKQPHLQSSTVTHNGVSALDHAKPGAKLDLRSTAHVSKAFDLPAKVVSVKNTETPAKPVSKSVTIVAAEPAATSVKLVEVVEKSADIPVKNGWPPAAPVTTPAAKPQALKTTANTRAAKDKDQEPISQSRRNHGTRPRFHTSPEVAQEDIVKATAKPQAVVDKSFLCESPKVSRALHRASSVSSSSPSSSGSFRASRDTSALEGQPSWLQLAQQRRELREQRERALLGRPAETSFVIETSKPSRSSKVLDMVSNFQKLQMT